MKKLFFILILSTLLSPLSSYSQSVEAKMDSIAIMVGEQTGMTITAKAPKGQKIVFPHMEARTYITPGVEIVEIEKDDTTETSDGLEIKRKILLTSFDEFAYKIPEQKVKIGGRIYQTNPLALKVISMDVDTLHKDKFFPPKDVQNNPFMWSEWFPVIWMLLLIILLSGLGWYLYRRLKQNKPLVLNLKRIRHIPAHKKALDKIEKIKTDRIMQSENQKEYYTQLTDTLRRYIEERFGFSAMEMTSDEIIGKLKEVDDPKMISELREIFRTADLVKFAKYTTLMNENDLNLVNAVNFIDQTKSADDVEHVETVQPTISEEEKKLDESRKIIKALLWVIGIASTLAFVYALYTIITLI